MCIGRPLGLAVAVAAVDLRLMRATRRLGDKCRDREWSVIEIFFFFFFFFSFLRSAAHTPVPALASSADRHVDESWLLSRSSSRDRGCATEWPYSARVIHLGGSLSVPDVHEAPSCGRAETVVPRES